MTKSTTTSTAAGTTPALAAAAAPAHEKHGHKPARTSAVKRLLGGAIVLAGLVWLGMTVHHAYYYESTDDAYVIGHLHQISPQVGGAVVSVRVQDNQFVHAGDVLAEIDPLQYQIAVLKAEAALAQTQAQAQQAVAAVQQADTQLAEARARETQAVAQLAQAESQFALAQLTLDRNERLLGNGGAVTQADVDNARSAHQVAQAATEAARANRAAAAAAIDSVIASQGAARAQTAAAAASISAATAALHDAQRQLGYTKITAPTDGLVGNRNVETGNQVVASQIIFGLAEPTPWIVANFKETQLARMQVGQPVELEVDAIPGQILHGRIDSVSPASGAQFALLPADNATGNFNKVVQRLPVKITLEPESAAAVGNRLRIGYSVIASVRVR